MKWVKCIYDSGGLDGVTVGKIYEVLSFKDGIIIDGMENLIIIIDDLGKKNSWFMNSVDYNWFEDATAEVRNNNINKVLDEMG